MGQEIDRVLPLALCVADVAREIRLDHLFIAGDEWGLALCSHATRPGRDEGTRKTRRWSSLNDVARGGEAGVVVVVVFVVVVVAVSQCLAAGTSAML